MSTLVRQQGGDMPRGTKDITEAVARVGSLKAALAEVLAQIAAEKAEAAKKAKAAPQT